MKELAFPKGFIWGVASASYQVEGATREDGRGESIWDRYCTLPGRVANGDTGDMACDHYHRYKEDVALMKQLGIQGYRFSIAWPRVMPQGRGAVSEKGLAFYSDLVDELLAAGIVPMVTLYHWDLPQALQDIGGWTNPDMPGYFLEFSKVVMDRLGDRVRHWMTLNEPFCTAFPGNYEGRHAPGYKDFSIAVRVSYYLYVAHGLVVKHFRDSGMEGEIGIALNLMFRYPYADTAEDIAAAKRADGYQNRWFIDPLIKGSYPQDMVDWYRSKGVVLPEFKAEDLKLMSQPLDFIGLNYYNDFHVRHDPAVWPIEFSMKNRPFVATSDRAWPLTEQGFYDMLLRLKNEYGVQRVLVTENGFGANDFVSMDGKVEDPRRIDYLKRHLAAMHRAIQDGVDIYGYMQWSFTDNFEWAFGYGSRFGLVFIDYPSQKRIVKQSGHWYSGVIKNNALTLGD